MTLLLQPSPNCFEDNNKLINFSLTGDFENRLFTFFDNCWDSHGIFYSLMRTKIIKKYKGLGDNYLAFDYNKSFSIRKR